MKKIPVTLISGFLGSGKTTLVNTLLSEKQEEKIAIIVNEFGEVNIDEKLILRTDEEIIEMNNGAICCVMRDDTTKVLLKLIENKELTFDRVFIETTGLANPIPIARAFLDKPALKERYTLDMIITMVDTSHISEQILHRPEAKDQIAAGDVIILNKTDLVDDQTMATAKARIRNINPIATLLETTNAHVSFKELQAQSHHQTYIHEYTNEDHHHEHDETMSFVLSTDKPLDLQKVAHWIGETIMLNAEHLMRYKGILNIQGMDERFVFQGVHEHFENRKDRKWKEDEPRKTEIVLIGNNLDTSLFQESFNQLIAE